MTVLDHPFVIGDFVWTALDYLGEAGIGRAIYPGDGGRLCRGGLDRLGLRRPGHGRRPQAAELLPGRPVERRPAGRGLRGRRRRGRAGLPYQRLGLARRAPELDLARDRGQGPHRPRLRPHPAGPPAPQRPRPGHEADHAGDPLHGHLHRPLRPGNAGRRRPGRRRQARRPLGPANDRPAPPPCAFRPTGRASPPTARICPTSPSTSGMPTASSTRMPPDLVRFTLTGPGRSSPSATATRRAGKLPAAPTPCLPRPLPRHHQIRGACRSATFESERRRPPERSRGHSRPRRSAQ